MGYYDAISEGYDELHGSEQTAKARIIVSELDLKGKKVLDIGAGSGAYDGLFEECSEKVNLDPSEELLKLNKSPKIRNIAGKAEKMPFEDDSFDIIVSLSALHHVQDIDRAVSEIKRAAKKGAQLAFSFFKRADNLDEWIDAIRQSFNVMKEIDEGKDLILICSN